MLQLVVCLGWLDVFIFCHDAVLMLLLGLHTQKTLG